MTQGGVTAAIAVTEPGFNSYSDTVEISSAIFLKAVPLPTEAEVADLPKDFRASAAFSSFDYDYRSCTAYVKQW